MLRRLSSVLIVLIVKGLLKTLKVKFFGDPIDQCGVVGFLHGEQLPLLLNRPKELPLVSPMSLSKDGDLQVEVMRHFKISAVRGSTSRGALSALRGLLRWLKEERGVVLIALDGPRGPYAHISPGALYLSKRLELPFWFCHVQCSRAIRLKTWDRFIIPLPFSSVEVHTYLCEPHEDILESLMSSCLRRGEEESSYLRSPP